MSFECSAKNEELVDECERLFHLQPGYPIEDAMDFIETTLIDKFNLPVIKIVEKVISAARFNYSSVLTYITLLNQIFIRFSILKSQMDKELIIKIHGMAIENNNENAVCHLNPLYKWFSDENDVRYMVLHDQIDRFWEYLINHEIEDFGVLNCIGKVSFLEAAALFGSANIFIFLISNFGFSISKRCLQFSFIGGNSDIINECLKHHQVDITCLKNAILSHNNEFFEDFYQSEQIFCCCNELHPIAESHNVKALFIMLMKDKNSIIPWCAELPESIDIFANEDFNLKKVDKLGRTVLHHAALSNNISLCKFLLHYMKGQIDLNAMDNMGKTPLQLAIMKNGNQVAQFLRSMGAI
ncbi:hypothetical protein TVAG_003710 [Trichomonas vaginalis G3]|uniref:DUF3447 domain-containing protein n=1 Tax=Trichomonas vaginalis (strain ATCC PRA-98 / G3) TaxID=412133 RepID=A2E585_TRIV3|nr:spectrin binding [Trichomonas vaginalis G3]EAY12165.1 hypothetical protein TVAG_003710 [Trichomonas vaginalis G3]KAI5515386.1 spectrin binding [Trichomonas vaginalis G3]|eukprot:XP_001324388.1 hypothetical protein [Trichomonas vaginalis G3]